jgi:hypothetical protein
MDAGRLLGHMELAADLAVGRASGDQGEKLLLAHGKAEGVLLEFSFRRGHRRSSLSTESKPSPPSE